MNKGLILLREDSENVEFLTEEVNGKKELFIEGIFAQAEVKNGNDRLYPINVLEEALDGYIKNFMDKKKSIGEIHHPEYPMPNPENAAIFITEMKWDGNNVYGKAKVINGGKGLIVKGLIEAGYRWGISTRGMGELKERSGINYVQKGYFMTAHDLVDNPSGPDCNVDKIMENTRWYMNESTGVWTPKMNDDVSHKINEELFLERLENHFKGMKK